MDLMENKNSTFNTHLGTELRPMSHTNAQNQAKKEQELGDRELKVIQKERELQKLMDEMKSGD